MEEALITGRTYSIVEDVLEITARRLKNPKFYKEFNGIRWTKANRRYFAKSKHLCEKTVTNAFNALIKAGIIIKDQLSKKEGDTTNWYAINPECGKPEMLERITSFFNKTIGNMIRNIIKGKISTLRVERFSPFNKSKKTPAGEKVDGEPAAAAAAPRGSASSPASGGEDKLKTTTAQDALAIWNETMDEDHRKPITRPLARMLVAAIKLKFQNLEKWREFCFLVKKSRFLMSKRIRHTLYFVLKFDVIDGILRGGYGTKPKNDNSKKGDNPQPANQNSPEPEKEIYISPELTAEYDRLAALYHSQAKKIDYFDDSPEQVEQKKILNNIQVEFIKIRNKIDELKSAALEKKAI